MSGQRIGATCSALENFAHIMPQADSKQCSNTLRNTQICRKRCVQSGCAAVQRLRMHCPPTYRVRSEVWFSGSSRIFVFVIPAHCKCSAWQQQQQC
eukprot:1300-Heterococcus_DN1.PRE.1